MFEQFPIGVIPGANPHNVIGSDHFFFFLLTEIFITTTSLTTLSLQNLRLQKITIKN